MITISNNNLSVKILEKGAELQSIQHNGYEYLWQANGKYWPKHSPVLFPVIGELKNGFYIFEEKEYKMSRHGFARDKIFKVTQADHNTASFTLYSDEQSLAIYPFHFIFNIDYKVEGNNLSCTYTVENNGNKTMYFSAGGHPAFNVPLNDKLEYSDYFLRFDDDTILSRYLLSDGLISNDIEALTLSHKTLPLKHSLFYNDAMVLKHINSKKVTLMSEKDSQSIEFNFDGFPYFGIWAAKEAPFVCLEPWCGIADNIDCNHQLIKKEGINQLAAGENWKRTWSIDMF